MGPPVLRAAGGGSPTDGVPRTVGVVGPPPAGTRASVGSMPIRSEPWRNGQPGLPVTVGVMAKAPVAGTSKTRMCPPLSPEEAARIAEAALVDTLQAVLGTPVRRHVVVLDGDPGPCSPGGW